MWGEGLLTISAGREFHNGITSMKNEWRWDSVGTKGWKRILLCWWRGEGEGWLVKLDWGIRERLLIMLYATLSLMLVLRVFSGFHARVSCRSVMSADQLCVTILPANFWTLSRLAMSCLRWGSQTAEQYSSFGRMVVLVILRRTSGGAWCSIRWIRPICLLADLQVRLICLGLG